MEAVQTLIGALALALPKLEGAKKDATNPAFKRGGKEMGYATLSSVIDALAPLKEHDLWFIQVSHERDNGACFETIVIHGPSADTMSLGTMFVPADKNNAHGFGSAQSYCRRYGLMAAFGLAAEDDDGNAAAGAPPKPAKEEPKRAATKPIHKDQISIIHGLIKAQSTKTTVDIINGYKKDARDKGLPEPQDFPDLTEQQGDAIIKALNKIIDKERIAKASPQRDEVLADEVPY